MHVSLRLRLEGGGNIAWSNVCRHEALAVTRPSHPKYNSRSKSDLVPRTECMFREQRAVHPPSSGGLVPDERVVDLGAPTNASQTHDRRQIV